MRTCHADQRALKLPDLDAHHRAEPVVYSRRRPFYRWRLRRMRSRRVVRSGGVTVKHSGEVLYRFEAI